jgi:uncharacterized protein YjiS (DUF1127 family)
MAVNRTLTRHDIPMTVRSGPSLTRWLMDTVREWRRRAQSRRELAGLSYAELKDIPNGLAAEAEKDKPFWQA